MQIIWAQKEFPKKITKSIFLAGPTPREKNVKSWRIEAIKCLEDNDYDGTVFIPEFEDGIQDDTKLDYSGQIEWEQRAMNMADIILFYLPRKMKDMPGLTSNDEWGYWKTSRKVILAFPENAEKVRYQEYFAKQLNIPILDSLEHALAICIDKLGDGAVRIDGETYIPLHVWNHPAFKNWYQNLQNAGNRLEEAKVEYTKYVGPKNDFLFFIVLWAKVWIELEKRYKENEVAIMRSDISSCLLYKLDKNDILNSDIVMVKEFRTPVNNFSGYVWELAGGSSFKDKQDPKQIIVDELKEETGVFIESDRIKQLEARQLQATSLTHKSYLFSCELSDKELEDIKEKQGKIFGNAEDTEMTYVEVVKLSSILKTDLVDWSNIGMIFSAIYQNLQK
jgi:hypothetical protein